MLTVPGTIITAVDISGLISSFPLAYLGSRGHKTRWLAAGTLLVGMSCFLRLLPHLIYGPGQDALALTVEYGGSYGTAIDNGSLNKSKSCERQLEGNRVCVTSVQDYDICTGIRYECFAAIGKLQHPKTITYSTT
jgi:hypothetical protein